jgi:hypothetical protein
LIEAIGTEPTLGKSAGGAVLAWRRAALAIDDYRRDAGWVSKTVGLGPRPDDPATRRAYDSAERAVAHLRRERMRQRGESRERCAIGRSSADEHVVDDRRHLGSRWTHLPEHDG